MADVEKRLNSSLEDLISQSKASGSRGAKVRLSSSSQGRSIGHC